MGRYKKEEIKVGDMVKQIIPPDKDSPTRDLAGMLLKVSAVDTNGYGGLQFFGISMRHPSHFFGSKRFKKVNFIEKLDVLLGSENASEGTGS